MKSLTDINIEKSRSGVYKDNSENRRLHRVGQRYGEPKKEESSKGASSLPTKGDLESSKDGSSIVVENVQTGNTVIFYEKRDGKWFSNHAMMTGGVETNPERMSRTLQGYNKKPYSIKPDLNVEESASDIQDLKRDKKEAEDTLKQLRKKEKQERKDSSKKPTSIRVKGGVFKVDDNGRILASAHGPQENVSKLLKFASENGYKLDWKEVNEEPERGIDKYARGGYLGIGFGGKTDWDDRQHRLTKILVGLAEQNSDLKNRLVDEVLKIRRDVDGRHFKNEKEARDLALFNFRNWVNRLETEDKLKYIKEAGGVNNGSNSEEAKNTNKKMNEAIKQGGESFTRVNLPDIPDAHKVNLTKYLSAKRKKAVDDAWNKAKFDSLPREKASVFQEGYNKLREQFNNNFDDMSKSERAELLYKILKMKNAMERK